MMNQRPSLMDQADANTTSSSGPPKNKGGGPNSQTLKIVGVSVLLLVAVVVMAWRLGFLTGPPKIDQAEQAARRARMEEEIKEDQRRDDAAPEQTFDAGG